MSYCSISRSYPSSLCEKIHPSQGQNSALMVKVFSVLSFTHMELDFFPLFSPSTVSASRKLVSSLRENRPEGIHEGLRWLILQQHMTRRQCILCLLLHNLKVEVWKMKAGSSVLYRYVGVLVAHSRLCRMSAKWKKGVKENKQRRKNEGEQPSYDQRLP